MIPIFKEVRALREEGKLHKRLLTRTRILFIISLVLASVVVYNLIAYGGNPLIALALAVLGFLMGIYLFSRIGGAVEWSEEASVVQTGRMDTVGYVALGLYILFEIGLRTFLADYFPTSATAYLLSAVFGMLLGRAIGTVIEIHKVYRQAHP